MIICIINCFALSLKCKIIIIIHSFLEPKVTSVSGFFCPTNSPKTKYHLFIMGEKRKAADNNFYIKVWQLKSCKNEVFVPHFQHCLNDNIRHKNQVKSNEVSWPPSYFLPTFSWETIRHVLPGQLPLSTIVNSGIHPYVGIDALLCWCKLMHSIQFQEGMTTLALRLMWLNCVTALMLILNVSNTATHSIMYVSSLLPFSRSTLASCLLEYDKQ